MLILRFLLGMGLVTILTACSNTNLAGGGKGGSKDDGDAAASGKNRKGGSGSSADAGDGEDGEDGGEGLEEGGGPSSGTGMGTGTGEGEGATDGTDGISMGTDVPPGKPPKPVPEGGRIEIESGEASIKRYLVKGAFVTGAGNSGGPHVRQYNAGDRSEVSSFFAYTEHFRGGVRVAMAISQDGDHYLATCAGAGGGPHVRVWKNTVEIASFFAYEESFRGGCYVALGDLNGDTVPDLVTGAGGGGGPRIRAFDLTTGNNFQNFFAFDPNFRGGARVAVGDIDGNGRMDIVAVPGPGGGPHVRAFDGQSGAELASFFAWPDEASTYRGGLHVATGRFEPATKKDLIIVGAGTPAEEDNAGYTGPGGAGASRVTVLRQDGSHYANFFAYDPNGRFGVRVASVDFDADGQSDLITCAGHDGGAHVRIFKGASQTELSGGFFAYDQSFRGGCFVGGPLPVYERWKKAK